MKTPVIFTLRGALCALVAVCAITVSKAEENKDAKEKKIPAGLLKKYDLNNDGVLDEKEKAAFEADKAKKKSEMEAKHLEKYDTNKDGKLDESERAAAKAAKEEAAEKKKAELQKKKEKAEKEASAPSK